MIHLVFMMLFVLAACSPDSKNNSLQNIENRNSIQQTDTANISGKTGEQLKILNYNVRTHIELMNENADKWLQKIVDAIVQFDPDIVGLVEVEEAIRGIDNIPAEINRRLTEAGYKHYSKYEIRFNQVSVDGNFGMMLISKVPIKDYMGYRPQYVENVQATGKDLIASFTYETGGVRLRFFNYHPHPGSCSCESVPLLIEHVQNSTDIGLKIISGDFNQEITSPCLKELLAKYRNAGDESRDSTCKYTVDRVVLGNAPPAKGGAIDHIMINKDAPVKVKVITVYSDHNANKEIPVSDHFPVYGIFSIE